MCTHKRSPDRRHHRFRGYVQLPQLSVPPQPSAITPQFLFCAAQVVGRQPQRFETPPPPQVLGISQGGHVTIIAAIRRTLGRIRRPVLHTSWAYKGRYRSGFGHQLRRLAQ